jgi:hypothetical protein
VPGIVQHHQLSARAVQQTVGSVLLIQELGSITGRLLFGILVVRVASRRRLLHLFLAPALVVFSWLFFFGARDGLTSFKCGLFVAQALFNGLHSFWGNYLPRVFPTHLRGTGESVAMNLGGRVLGVSAALLTTQLSNVMPAADATARLAYSAGTTAVVVLALAAVASLWLEEPRTAQLPD